MDADGQAYEALRQQNIRENAEFLKSLFKDQEIKLGPAPDQKKASAPRKRRGASVDDETKDFEPASRKSSRIASSDRRSLRERDLLPSVARVRVKKEKKLRQGSRKSDRASSSKGRYTDWKSDEDDDSDAYVPAWRGRSASRTQGHSSDDDEDDNDRQSRTFDLSGRPILKKLSNPIAPLLPTGGGDEVYEERKPIPGRVPMPEGTGKGALIFDDYPQFAPNVTPEEMFRGGVFGCTAFRDYRSRVLQGDIDVEAELEELPQAWLEGLDVDLMLREPDPVVSRNKFKVKAGQTLEDWEKNGWIRPLDPRGWFQWYYRFYLGRRSADDARQISRWLKACGPGGRFRKALAQNIAGQGGAWDDPTVNSVVRQTLWQWGYEMTERDYRAYFPV